MGYLGINPTKQVKELCAKNYKMLMMEITEDPSKRREIPYSCIGRLNIVQMSILSKVIYRFNAILIQFSARCFVNTHKLILKFILKGEDLG